MTAFTGLGLKREQRESFALGEFAVKQFIEQGTIRIGAAIQDLSRERRLRNFIGSRRKRDRGPPFALRNHNGLHSTSGHNELCIPRPMCAPRSNHPSSSVSRHDAAKG
jgi:hypothetical protein